MVTNNAINIATGATGTVLQGQGVASSPLFTNTPSVTSITFGAGTAMSNYTEGTWTPTIDGAASGTTTYVAQNGYYTRTGNKVFVMARISITAATGTGNAIIGGFPFTIRSNTNGDPVGNMQFNNASLTWTWPAARTQLTLRGLNNTTTALIVGSGSVLSASNLQMFNTSCIFNLSLIYTV